MLVRTRGVDGHKLKMVHDSSGVDTNIKESKGGFFKFTVNPSRFTMEREERVIAIVCMRHSTALGNVDEDQSV